MRAQMTNFGILFLLCLLPISAQVGRAQEPPTMTVCELFKDPAKWNGELVAVHGEVIFSPYMFSVAEEGNCPNLPVTDGKNWPAQVWLGPVALTTDPSFAKAYPRSVEMMGELVRAFNRVYWYPPYPTPVMEPPFRITATFIGTFHTHCPKCDGYGTGEFPAEMRYIAVKDVTIIGLQTPTPEDPSK